MLAGLLLMEGGDRMLPFVRLFHSDPSVFLWEDDLGTVHHIVQGEGKGTHSCPCCSVLDNMRHWLLWPRGWKSENDFSLAWSPDLLREELWAPR